MTEPTWNTIDEKPPENTQVWLYTRSGRIEKGQFYCGGYQCKKLNVREEITHWMEIPDEKKPNPPTFADVKIPDCIEIAGFKFALISHQIDFTYGKPISTLVLQRHE